MVSTVMVSEPPWLAICAAVKVPLVRPGFLTITAAVALGTSLAIVPVASSVASAAPSAQSSPVKASVFTLPLHEVGQINLSAAAKAEHRTKVATHPQAAPISRSAIAGSHLHAVDNTLISRRLAGFIHGDSIPAARWPGAEPCL